MDEQWKQIAGLPYEVSTGGRCRRMGGRVVSTHKNGTTIRMWSKGVECQRSLPREILIAFVRPPTPGERAIHVNNDVKDHRLDNLRWGTQSDAVTLAHARGAYR